MSRTHFELFKIHQYFPPDNELAIKIVRVCILAEDFFIEAKGYISKTIPDLDINSSEWRKLYFLRNCFRTIHELRKAIDNIRMDKTFEGYLQEQNKNIIRKYEGLYLDLKNFEKLFKNVRDEIGGGHVLIKAVRKGLEEIDPFEKAFWKLVRHTKIHILSLSTKLCMPLWYLTFLLKSPIYPKPYLMNILKKS